MSFEPITTQEAFDAAIQERINREKEKYEDYEELKEKAGKYDVAKKERDEFETTIEELNKAIDGDEKNPGYKKQVSDLTGEIEGYKVREMKVRIARKNGIPSELAERLTGKDEEELEKDAEAMSKILKSGRKTQPLASTETSKDDDKRSALKQTLDAMKGDN